MGTEGQQTPERSAGKQWTFPGYADRSAADAEQDENTPSVKLITAPLDQARSMCVRLEAEGIPCTLARQPDAADDADCVVLVREADVEAAGLIISDPSPTQEDADENEEERLVDDWICPTCRRRTLITLPRASGWRFFKLIWLAVFGIPLLVSSLLGILPSPEMQAELYSIPGEWIALWLVFVTSSAALLVFWPRGKRCTKCLWRSDALQT